MRTKFAPVCGIGMMEALFREDLLGPHHLWLAHDVLQEPERWGDLASSLRMRWADRGQSVCIIMDNSLIELGYPMADQDLLDACKAVAANYVVLPDLLTKHAATVNMGMQFVDRLGTDLAKCGVDKLGVIQGENWEDLMQCARDLAELCGADMLSVPRVVQRTLGSRYYFTHQLCEHTSLYIHLLGFSDSMVDDLATAATCHRVVGIDSAVPIRLGLYGKRVTNMQQVREIGPRSSDYLGVSNPTPEVIYNMRTMNRWLS